MLALSSTLLVLAWASVPSGARPQSFPPRVAFNPRPPTSQLELQRVGGGIPSSRSQPVANTGDYTDAIYAANLARELTRLEVDKKTVYVDFISSLYMNPQVPGRFPPDLQRLSRGASPLGPSRIIASTSSSFGPLPHPHPPPPAGPFHGLPIPAPQGPHYPLGRPVIKK